MHIIACNRSVDDIILADQLARLATEPSCTICHVRLLLLAEQLPPTAYLHRRILPLVVFCSLPSVCPLSLSGTSPPCHLAPPFSSHALPCDATSHGVLRGALAHCALHCAATLSRCCLPRLPAGMEVNRVASVSRCCRPTCHLLAMVCWCWCVGGLPLHSVWRGC